MTKRTDQPMQPARLSDRVVAGMGGTEFETVEFAKRRDARRRAQQAGEGLEEAQSMRPPDFIIGGSEHPYLLREWGFHCHWGFRIWREFVAPADTGSVGRGCE